eukprot:TRINITY_DN10710_c0_g1_i1.p1 TRINITY_DN10710_c0_g1~~TRINITY_DN10710_c0_g1_i1.p1  ORF type:complete len:307 (+),score=54.97 TRINITY_DN10710_c0_g1_i1:169-1089(+)
MPIRLSEPTMCSPSTINFSVMTMCFCAIFFFSVPHSQDITLPRSAVLCELFHYIVQRRSLSEEQARGIFQQLLEAVHFCHGCDVVHRDLKPENIVFVSTAADSKVKIIDWGFAKQVSAQHQLDTPLFTNNYAPPEVAARLGGGGSSYTAACDIWSLGVVLYTMLAGRSPYQLPQGVHSSTPEAWQRAFAEQQLDLTSDPWPSISAPAKELLGMLLRKDPGLRPSAAQACRHPWLVKPDIDQFAESLPSPAVMAPLLKPQRSNSGRAAKRHPALREVAGLTDLARLAPVQEASLLTKRAKAKASSRS